ncbi:aglC [Symbiodinium natans]|uniref:AglC protein n=1 Tax=Symbiodinium natans TaxID=878477 RepID=A0A812R4U2_9DINO|nr:aglC [Symbiodinium natans]
MLLHDLSEVIVHLLDVSSDSSALQLAAASHGLRKAVERCRGVACEGPWRHAAGAWEVAGLWRFLGLGDLHRIPAVTLYCDMEFQHVGEVVKFLKAAKALASDTVDGRVTFSKFSFDPREMAELFDGEEDDFMTTSDQTADVVFNGCNMTCSVDAHSEGGPWPTLNLWVHEKDDEVVPQNVLMCSSLLLPELRLCASCEDIEGTHMLDGESPLTELVRTGMPLPMLIGVSSSINQWDE